MQLVNMSEDLSALDQSASGEEYTVVSPLQFMNILLRSVVLDGWKLDKSKETRDEHAANIRLMSVTCETSKLDTSREVSAIQLPNIFDM